MEKYITLAVNVVPSARQLAWQETEFYAFVHFSPNTFTNMEWGLGNENPNIFNPTQLDTRQWAKAIKSAGMKGMILTCKHHDGFCLWPSKLTEHSVKNCPWKDGKGDIVKEAADACREEGLKFGVYLSPWDRHEQCYGNSPVYNKYFIGQLTELLTNYGEVFSVWFDGACGEGPNGKRQEYDWEAYYETIRKLQPNAAISVCGPDTRWCGNEAGHCRTSEWSVVPEALMDVEKIQEKSQQVDDGEFSRRISSSDDNLGGREAIEHAGTLVWYPAEVNTSIRPGWFYHAEEDDKVRSLEELLSIYYSSVGGNATFLLNIPPDKRGLLHENDVERLREIGDYLKESFSENLADDAKISADSHDEGNEIKNVRHDSYESYFKTQDGKETAVIELSWDSRQEIRHIVMKENILCGQRIEEFTIEAETDGEFEKINEGTVVGYKRIVKTGGIKTSRIRINILESRIAPTLSFIGVY